MIGTATRRGFGDLRVALRAAGSQVAFGGWPGSRDWEKVREVRRKYFHTKAGYEASLLLAQHEMFGGHPLAASLLLDDVVTVARAVDHLGKGVRVLHASASKLAQRELPSIDTGRPAAAKWSWAVRLIRGRVKASFPIGWLRKHFGRLEDFAGSQPLDYPVFGVRPSRNGASSGQMPLTNKRWMLRYDRQSSSGTKRASGRRRADDQRKTAAAQLDPAAGWAAIVDANNGAPGGGRLSDGKTRLDLPLAIGL